MAVTDTTSQSAPKTQADAQAALDLLDKVPALLAALRSDVSAALDAEQQKRQDAAATLRQSNPGVDFEVKPVNRSDEARIDAALAHLATVRMHVDEIRHGREV